MPEIIVRKRLGPRPGDRRVRLIRWFHRNSARISVVAAFLAAGLVCLIAVAEGLPSIPVKTAVERAAPR